LVIAIKKPFWFYNKYGSAMHVAFLDYSKGIISIINEYISNKDLPDLSVGNGVR